MDAQSGGILHLQPFLRGSLKAEEPDPVSEEKTSPMHGLPLHRAFVPDPRLFTANALLSDDGQNGVPKLSQDNTQKLQFLRSKLAGQPVCEDRNGCG